LDYLEEGGKSLRRCRDCQITEEKVCACECGGTVWGTRSFGRLWSWCDRCTPVQKVGVDSLKVRGLSK
jgi:hypothetical protein